jgi:predicted glycosyltransferase involved in capsule biosynthesis
MAQFKLLPYRLTCRNGLVNTTLLAPLRRAWLKNRLKALSNEPDSITIAIGIRNRSDYRLRNALWSLANQDYPKDLVKIVVVDYGSSDDHKERTIEICNRFDAKVMFLAAPAGWNRSKCLNFAIKQVKTKYFLSSDVDMIYQENYLRELMQKLKENPLSVVCSRMMDLPEKSIDVMRTLAEKNLPVPYQDLINMTTSRGAGDSNASINCSYTLFYQYIRGYDEFYQGWGSEDNDLMKRFISLGLDICSIAQKATYLHQWHPKGEGIADFDEAAQRNREYCEKNNTIIRNKLQWGEG